MRKRSSGLKATYVDLSDAAALEAAIRPDTHLVWVETPTNPLLKLADLARVASVAHLRGIWTVADNTFASPWIQRPLEHGFEHSDRTGSGYMARVVRSLASAP